MINTILVYVAGALLNMAAGLMAFAFVSLWLSPRNMLAWWRTGPQLGQIIVATLWPIFVVLWLHKDWRDAK